MQVQELKDKLSSADAKIIKNKNIITQDFLARLKVINDKLVTLNPSAVMDMAKFIGFEIVASDVQTVIDGINLFIETETDVLAGTGDQAQKTIENLLKSPFELAVLARMIG